MTYVYIIMRVAYVAAGDALDRTHAQYARAVRAYARSAFAFYICIYYLSNL